MPYAQIDISAPRHRKVTTLSAEAFRLWVFGLCYCQEHLTDGVLHSNAVRALLPGQKVKAAIIDELVSGGLWDHDPENGYRVHDYLGWNESRQQVLARREKWRVRRRTGERTQERTQERPPSTQPSVPSGVSDTLRYAPIRSTDRDQKHEEHPPAGGARPRLRTTDQTEAPKPTLLAAIARDVLTLDPTLDGADLKDALKARAAQLRVPYDAESVRKALDGVQAAQARTSRRREERR